MTTNDTRFPWLPILALAAGTLWTVTAELLPAGLLLDISDDTGVAPGSVGYLVTAWGLAIAVLSLPLTRLTRRIDRRTLLVSSLVVTGGATVLTALAPTYPLLTAARTLAAAAHGLFWALVVVTAGSLVAERYAARAIAVVVAGPTVGTVLAIPAATALGEASGWRSAFGVVGLLTVATGLLVRVALPQVPPAPAGEQGRRDPSVPVVVRVAVLGAVLLVAHFAAYTFIAPILTGPGGLSRSSVSMALLVFGAAGVVGLFVAPTLVGRLPHWSLPITGVLLAGSLVAVRAAGRSELLELGAVALWGVVIGAVPVVFQTRLLALASPAFRPTAGAVLVVAFNLGVASGAALGGTVNERLGAGALPVVGAALALIAALGLARVGRSSVRPAETPEMIEQRLGERVG
ncbi:MFS transporter [Nocardioides sp. GCM10030259]|uniref:MFS transporter n=1 Tax=Nocardioides sp. GCM10030259 TaxID=3273410 RepID=UPI0036202502